MQKFLHYYCDLQTVAYRHVCTTGTRRNRLYIALYLLSFAVTVSDNDDAPASAAHLSHNARHALVSKERTQTVKKTKRSLAHRKH